MRVYGLVLVLTLAGCKKGGGSDLVLTDDNNYSIDSSSLTFGHFPVLAETDTTIDWSALTADLRGRPLDPTSVDQVVVSLITMPEDELTDRVLSNDIPLADATPSTFGNSEHGTSVLLSQLDTVGNPFDLSTLVGGADHTWVATLLDVVEGTGEQQVLYSVVLDPGDTGDAVNVADGVSTVSVFPNLHDPVAVQATAGADAYTIDWSELTTDTFRITLDNTIANTLIVLHYDGAVADVESDFLLADYHATEEYKFDVSGYDGADLSQPDNDGQTFPGFTTDGTWLVGLVDSKSLSPLPLVMAVVEATE